MTFVVASLGLVALLQGVAWMVEPQRPARWQRGLGVWLAPLGLAVFALGVIAALAQ